MQTFPEQGDILIWADPRVDAFHNLSLTTEISELGHKHWPGWYFIQ